MEPEIRGACDPAFEPVRSAFRANFTDRGEVGAAVCVIHAGEVVVDLVGGWADEARTRAWTHDTLCDFYSVGKSFLALLLLRSIDAGLVGLDDPVGSLWPEFATRGKAGATLRHVLCHQAGVPAIRERLHDDELFDWGRMTGAIAATEAWFPPGSRHAYHTNTFGHIAGELVHRVTATRPGDALRALAEPLGAEVHFGVPASQQHRCADVIWSPAAPIPSLDADRMATLGGDAAMSALAHLNPPGYSSIGLVNTPRWRALPLGSTSGHGSARGIATIYAALAERDRLVSHDLLREATRPQSTGPCPILRDEATFGLGFTPTTPRRPFGPNPRSFGHFGTGGALGFADPAARIGFGYVMNHVIPRWQSSRNRALVDAVYAERRGGSAPARLSGS